MKFATRIITLSLVFAAALLLSGCVSAGQKTAGTAPVSRFEQSGDKGQGYISYGHSKYRFELQLPAYLVEGELTPTIMGSFAFPESYTTGTNLTEAYFFINRKGRTCEELGYGFPEKPAWYNGKTISLSGDFSEKIFIGDAEFTRQFCSHFESESYLDALVYTTEKDGEPVSLSLVLISLDPASEPAKGMKLYDAAVFEKEYLDIMKTYKNTKESNNN